MLQKFPKKTLMFFGALVYLFLLIRNPAAVIRVSKKAIAMWWAWRKGFNNPSRSIL